MGLIHALTTNLAKRVSNPVTGNGVHDTMRQNENFQRILLGTATLNEISAEELLRLPPGFIPTRLFLGRPSRTTNTSSIKTKTTSSISFLPNTSEIRPPILLPIINNLQPPIPTPILFKSSPAQTKQ